MRICLLITAVFVCLTTFPGNADASGHVYLLKGLAGIFSTGLDTLEEKLVQRGITATVHSHIYYESLATEAAHLVKIGKGPIIIIGHSLGAGAAIDMAEKMKTAGAPVALVVTFGPNGQLIAPANVAHVINYDTGGAIVSKGPGFKGTISNVNLDEAPGINHLNVEKIDRLHAQVIARIQTIVGLGYIGRTSSTKTPLQ